MTFQELELQDHHAMLNSNEFGRSFTSTRTGVTFTAIVTDAFVKVDDSGLMVIEDKPMFNTMDTVDILEDDILTSGTKSYTVREFRRDGIGGQDVYLRD